MMTTLNFFSLVSFISAHSYLPYLKKKKQEKKKVFFMEWFQSIYQRSKVSALKGFVSFKFPKTYQLLGL